MTPSMRSPRSIRTRIARGLAALLLVFFVGVWGILAERTLRGLEGSLDESLESLIEFVARNAVVQAGVGSGEPADYVQTWTADVEDAFLEIRDWRDGTLLSRAPHHAGDYNLVDRHSWDYVRKRADDEGWNENVKGERVRCMAARVDMPTANGAAPRPLMFVVGMERDVADRRFHEIVTRAAYGLGGAFVLALTGAWFIVWRALKPLAGLVDDVSAITPEVIRPVRVPDEPNLALLAERLNRSLEAVGRSLTREKRFSGDVAHELLTPLGGLRAQLDVALMKPREREELQAAMRSCQTMVLELQNMVENLLNLGRIESGTSRIAWTEIELAQTIDGAWDRWRAEAERRGIAWENRIGSDVRAVAGFPPFDFILKNLIENAMRYTRPGGRAWAECAEEPDGIVLAILNESEALPEDFVQCAFERFWRGDPSRSRRRGAGAGLGLSLARSAAEATGGTLTVEVLPGPVVRFSLTLKRTETASS